MSKFDGKLVPRGTEQLKCALHVLHTTTATTEQVKCVFSIIRIVGHR